MDDLINELDNIAGDYNGIDVYSLPLFDEGSMKRMRCAIKEFVSQKCKEQRQICADNAEGELEDFREMGFHYIVNKDSILNAPEPEL